VTFVEKLKAAGYFTAAAGKWHLGENVKDRFDVVHAADVVGFQLPSGKDTIGEMIAKSPSGCEAWLSTLRNRPPGRPFFMWFAALDPHRAYEPGALQPPHRLSDVLVPPHLPDTPEVREDLRLYYDEIGRLDQYVGQVMLELTAQGVAGNTVILFISDNGRPFPRDKTTLYDGGIRTPWIVRWPERVRSGSVSQSLVSAVDIAPTLLAIAGIDEPAGFAGVSFLPVLFDPQAKVRDYVFAEDHWHDYADHGRAVSNHRYKLIRNDYYDLPATPPADAGRSPTWQTMRRLRQAGRLTGAQLACFQAPRPRYELYDLDQDPGERSSLVGAPDCQAVFDELVKALQDWSVTTDDYVPSIRTPDEFDRATGAPDHSVRVRPRRSKKQMYGTNGKY
jgi:arylsulfatase A-like enzyme